MPRLQGKPVRRAGVIREPETGLIPLPGPLSHPGRGAITSGAALTPDTPSGRQMRRIRPCAGWAGPASASPARQGDRIWPRLDASPPRPTAMDAPVAPAREGGSGAPLPCKGKGQGRGLAAGPGAPRLVVFAHVPHSRSGMNASQIQMHVPSPAREGVRGGVGLRGQTHMSGMSRPCPARQGFPVRKKRAPYPCAMALHPERGVVAAILASHFNARGSEWFYANGPVPPGGQSRLLS